MFAVRCQKRDELEKHMEKNGIKTVKHYPVPLHMQMAYKDLDIQKGELPVAEEISKTILSIPMYYGMKEEETNYVIKIINEFK